MTSGTQRPAFRAIFDGEYGYIRNSVVRLGVRAADVADVVHDVFVVVHEKLDDYDPARPLRPWLFGITFRVAVGVKRKLRYRRETVGDDDDVGSGEPSRAPSPEQAASAAERRAILAKAMDVLDDDKRAVFVLHDLDGASMPVVAESLGVPLNTAYSRLRLAREELRAFLARRGITPEGP